MPRFIDVLKNFRWLKIKSETYRPGSGFQQGPDPDPTETPAPEPSPTPDIGLEEQHTVFLAELRKEE
jgi:hypothetical protein